MVGTQDTHLGADLPWSLSGDSVETLEREQQRPNNERDTEFR